MGKMKAMSEVLEELQQYLAGITDAVKELVDLFSGTETGEDAKQKTGQEEKEETESETVQETGQEEGQEADKREKENAAQPEPVYTIGDVRAKLAEKSRQGFAAQVKSLLSHHGAGKLSEVKESEYASIMTEAESIGICKGENNNAT